MFCTKCGSQLEDGVKFCTNCGAPTVFAQAVPAAPAAPEAPAPVQPEAPAPAASVPTQAESPAAPLNSQPQSQQPQANSWQQPQAGTWQQPQQPQANNWQQPQQPQAGTWQQPQQPQAGNWQQPRQPQAGNWQQPQQPQANNWQQTRQGQQPGQQNWPQPGPWMQQPQQNVRGAAPGQPKKSPKGLIIGIIAAVLVLVVGVGGFVWPGFFKRSKSSGGPLSTALAERFSTPEEYYRAVESNNANALAGHVSSVYDNVFLSNASSDDISVTGSLSIEPGDKLRELAIDLIGAQIDQLNPGDDLKWLKSISLAYDVSKKDQLSAINAALQLNGTDLAHLNCVVQIEDGVLCLSVPELSDRYLKTTLEDMNLDRMSLGSVLGSFSAGDAEKIEPVVKALPDAKTVSKVLETYLTEAVECIDDVGKETAELTAEDVTAEYTVLTATITPETVIKIVEKIGPELKEDKDIRKAILDVAAAAEQEGEAKYKAFTDKIDELLNDTSKITENMKDNIVVTVYLDKAGDVHGRIVEMGSRKLELLMPEKDGQFGLTLRCCDENGEKFLISGGGKRSGDKLTGDLDLQIDGEYYAVLGLDGFDIEKCKDGFLVGAVTVKPTASLWSKLPSSISELPESIKSVLEAMELRFDLNTSKDKGTVKLTLGTGTDKLISITVDGAKSSAKKISTVDGVEPNEWAEDVSLDKLEKVVANIEKAGVPTAYTDLLDQLLDNAF